MEDLKLWIGLLDHSGTHRISINNITIYQPNALVISYACTRGMGGYTIQGQAWRYHLPQEIINKFSINFLEFLASVISIDILLSGMEQEKSKGKHISSISDNSRSVGWMHNASFHPKVKKAMIYWQGSYPEDSSNRRSPCSHNKSRG